MTKSWELHEVTIKELYKENTLAVVRRIMIERYNFKASTRAYRGRLIKWNVRKYNRRRPSDGSSMSAGSPDGSSSGSDTASPTLSQSNVEASPNFTGYPPTSSHMRDNQPSMSNLLGHSYDTTGMETSRNYTERNRTLMSPAQEAHGWHSSPAQSASPPTSYAHANTTVASVPIYGYQPLSPPSSTYSTLAYESDQASCDRRQSFPLTHARQYTASHGSSTYYPVRDYGHEHGSPGIGSFNSSCDQVTRHNSTG
ncbi:hypothetical protein F4678DRAFT_450518 [Xylaria arbuscula]|nr:hypothetical protein F4678DRAFT_450518 [Xylaria arbuscula]